MLSGETANGAYPVEAVTTMTRIAEVTEQACYLRSVRDELARCGYDQPLSAVCFWPSVRVAKNLGQQLF